MKRRVAYSLPETVAYTFRIQVSYNNASLEMGYTAPTSAYIERDHVRAYNARQNERLPKMECKAYIRYLYIDIQLSGGVYQ